MKKLTTILLIALLIPAGYTFAQMQWHDKDSGNDVMFFRGQGRCVDGPGMGRGAGCGMGHGQGMGPGMGMCMGPGMRGPDGPQHLMAMAKELELTDDQVSKLQTMATQFRLDRVDKEAALEKAQISLQALIRDNADEGKVFAGIDEVTQLKADMQKMQYRHRKQMKGVLTQEQQKKLQELRSERPMGQGMGKQGHRGMKRGNSQFDSDG